VEILLARRAFMAGVGFGLVSGLSPRAIAAEAFPAKPIRIIIGFGAGGHADITMRILSDKHGERLGQRVIVENRPGAGGVVAAQAVASSAADGYTLLVLSIGTAISVSLIKSLPFDPTKDFVPISSVAGFDLLFLVKADSPIKTLQDLLAEAKKRGSAMNIATINAGSSQNLSAELFKTTAGINATIVPYRTTPETLIALTRGDVTMVMESYAALKGAIDAGQVRAIASSGPKRSLPNVPTAQESGLKDYDVTGWNALFAPVGTPPDVVALLNKNIGDVLKMPDVQKRIHDLGTDVMGSTPDELGKLLRDDIAMWGAVIQRAGIERR
jgi:tripartite-type tricarboxylate transporter receptor subunit TctC